MTTLPVILVTILVAAVVIPLALLLIFIIADALGLPFADTILSIAVHAIIVEFAIGSVVNVVGGIAVAALGIWGSWHFGGLPHRLLSLILIPVGLWRLWRGAMIWVPGDPAPNQSRRDQNQH